MEYLDNIVNNLREAERTFVPQRELFIGGGTKMGTIAFGYCELGNERIYLAKKIPGNERLDLAKKFLRDLWFIDLGWVGVEYIPQFESQFPRLYGIQYDGEGQPVGIIMEDYSQRHSLHLVPAKFNELPLNIPNLIQTEDFDVQEFEHAGIKIRETGQVKLIDFDTHATPDLSKYVSYLEQLRFNPRIFPIH